MLFPSFSYKSARASFSFITLRRIIMVKGNATVTTKIKKNQIHVERRSVYSRGRRTFVYDARGTLDGTEYRVTEKTKAEAISAAIAEIEFMRAAKTFEAGGCSVSPNGFESWVFTLPAPSRCAMVYGAKDLATAVARAVDGYREHPDAQYFVKAAAVMDVT